MTNKVLIRVFELIGNSVCVSSDDGQKLHDQIAKAIRENYQVDLSFLNVEILTSAFLNSAIGQLYGEFSSDKLKENLSVIDISQDDLALLQQVIETAKEYFKNPKEFEQKKRDAWGETDE